MAKVNTLLQSDWLAAELLEVKIYSPPKSRQLEEGDWLLEQHDV